MRSSCRRSFSASSARNFSCEDSRSFAISICAANRRSCAMMDELIPRAIADSPCLVDLIFSAFLFGGGTTFVLFLVGSSSSSSALPASYSSSYLSANSSSTSELCASLLDDERFNGACVSENIGFRTRYQCGSLSGSKPEPFYSVSFRCPLDF